MKAPPFEITRLTKLLRRRQATINRLQTELAAAKALNQEIGAALNEANERANRHKAQADMWRAGAAPRESEADTRMDPLEAEAGVPTFWQRIARMLRG